MGILVLAVEYIQMQISLKISMGFPGGTSGKEPICQCRRHRFDPWVGKILWSRKRQSALAFLPGKSHGQKNLKKKKKEKKIPWTEEPGRLRSMGPQRVGHE